MSASFTHRLAVATSSLIPDIHPDDAHLAASLRRLGIETVACVWNDPSVDWSQYDAVLMRSTWDYFQHYAAFSQWLDALPIPTINNKALLRWNSNKRYLPELAKHGVDIIPTTIVSAKDLPHALSAMHRQEVVIKPTISGTAWHTVRGVVGDTAMEQAIAQLPQAFEYLVQPYLPEIVTDGEWSLIFFEGEYSHAVIKRPADGDYRVQGEFGGTARSVEPDATLIASAKQALVASAAMGYADIAYARVDGVMTQGRFLLMELEVIEPLLHLGGRPETAERFAAHLQKRLAA
jgi:glutathione synthase/RimK-type ligase-like ATP-grasp enzyme